MSWIIDSIYDPLVAFYAVVFNFSASPTSDLILDVLILLLAFVPACYISARFLFDDPLEAQRLVKSPTLKSWLIFFCSLEVVLHLLKVPLILKVLVVLLALLLLPLVFVGELVAR